MGDVSGKRHGEQQWVHGQRTAQLLRGPGRTLKVTSRCLGATFVQLQCSKHDGHDYIFF